MPETEQLTIEKLNEALNANAITYTVSIGPSATYVVVIEMQGFRRSYILGYIADIDTKEKAMEKCRECLIRFRASYVGRLGDKGVLIA